MNTLAAAWQRKKAPLKLMFITSSQSLSKNSIHGVRRLMPALLTGVICTTEGLSVMSSITQVPLAVRRALGRALAALFLTTVVISLLTYL